MAGGGGGVQQVRLVLRGKISTVAPCGFCSPLWRYTVTTNACLKTDPRNDDSCPLMFDRILLYTDALVPKQPASIYRSQTYFRPSGFHPVHETVYTARYSAYPLPPSNGKEGTACCPPNPTESPRLYHRVVYSKLSRMQSTRC